MDKQTDISMDSFQQYPSNVTGSFGSRPLSPPSTASRRTPPDLHSSRRSIYSTDFSMPPPPVPPLPRPESAPAPKRTSTLSPASYENAGLSYPHSQGSMITKRTSMTSLASKYPPPSVAQGNCNAGSCAHMQQKSSFEKRGGDEVLGYSLETLQTFKRLLVAHLVVMGIGVMVLCVQFGFWVYDRAGDKR